MNLRELGKMALLPAPHHIVRGRLRYIALAMLAVGSLAVFMGLKPAWGSPTWWMAMGLLGMGLVVAVLNWRRIPMETAILFSIITDLMATGILWANPAHSEVGMLFVLISTFVAALYHGRIVLIHMLLVAVALGVHVSWYGGQAGTVWFIAVAVLAIITFLRGINVALHEQVSENRGLQYMIELIPVLKAHGMKDVVKAAVHQLIKATASDSGIVFMLDRQRQVLRAHFIHYTSGLSKEEEAAWLSAEVPVGLGLGGWVAQHRQSLITGDAMRDPRGYQVPGTPVGDESIMLVPLMQDSQIYGVLRLQREGLHQYRTEDVHLLELLATHVSDALARAELEERLARTDALTGVYNRHYLNEWSQVLKPTLQQISVLMIDCREFKRVNDRWGHLVGDRLLQEAARLIGETVRGGDLVFRYGGDEFLVVLGQAGLEEANAVAKRLGTCVSEWNDRQPIDGPTLNLDIGVDTAHQSEWQELLNRADVRMYASKRGA